MQLLDLVEKLDKKKTKRKFEFKKVFRNTIDFVLSHKIFTIINVIL